MNPILNLQSNSNYRTLKELALYNSDEKIQEIEYPKGVPDSLSVKEISIELFKPELETSYAQKQELIGLLNAEPLFIQASEREQLFLQSMTLQNIANSFKRQKENSFFCNR